MLFDREIVRILNSHCVMCHGDRRLSFPLSTYEQTWLRGRDDPTAGAPPPHAALGGGCRATASSLNDNSLTLRETQFMVSWVEGPGTAKRAARCS